MCIISFGANSKFYYRIFYVLTLVLGSVLSLDLAVNIVDAMFALMAFPTDDFSIIFST